VNVAGPSLTEGLLHLLDALHLNKIEEVVL
jgi:hypothetical protein